MGQRSRRHDRLRSVAEALLAAVLCLFLSLATAAAQTVDASTEDVTGSVWRLVRGGGGFVSPEGTTGASLWSVASNGETFVAVGDDGLIVHSSDGDRWVEAGYAVSSGWFRDVAWGGGRFVAVSGYQIVFSSDGDRWQRARFRGSGDVESVTWGNGRFVAVGDDGLIMESSDGDRWRRVRDRATRADLHGVAWAGGRFTAVGSDGTVVSSADGEHWQPTDTGTAATLTGVAWNGELFVAVGSDEDHRTVIVHSPDGHHWKPASLTPAGASGPLSDIVWSGERFVAIGSYAILHSGDGDAWERALWHGRGEFRAVAWGGASFVAIDSNGPILNSPDGVLWEEASEAGSGTARADLQAVAWGRDRFVAVAGWPPEIVHSFDGQEWQEASGDPGFRISDVIWDGDRFVAVGYGVAYSSDGHRWQRARMSLKTPHAVAWNGERYVAVGHDGAIVHSDDGDRWSPAADSATTETLNDVAWNGEIFVAVGYHGIIVHSTDGDTWQLATRPAVPYRHDPPRDDGSRTYYYGFEGLAWNGEKFVAVGWGSEGVVVHSRDGDQWELADDHDYLAGEHLTAVAWSGERFVAVSYRGGSVMISTDGDRWDPAGDVGTLDRLMDVAWGGGRFVAVGANGTIVTSP